MERRQSRRLGAPWPFECGPGDAMATELRRQRRLRPLSLQERMGVGSAARSARRPARATARLRACALERERAWAVARPGRSRRDGDRRQGPLGSRLQSLGLRATIRTGAMAAESCSSAASRTTRLRLFTHACARGGRRPRRMDDARTFVLPSRQSAYWRSSPVSVAKHRAGQKPLLR